MVNYNFNTQPAILIQGAMDTETQYLISQLKKPEKTKLGNWVFHTGFLGRHNQPVIISKTFQGLVNAAAATSLGLAHFQVKSVINQGIGGGHDKSFHRGDIVLGEKVIPMGAAAFSYAPQGAGIDPAAFDLLAVEIYNRRLGRTEKIKDFPCDERLLAAAESMKTRYKAKRGIIGSADEWNNQLDRITLLRERYQTAVEDMESAAAAQLCLSYGIPFIGIRILSNSIVNGEEFDESVGEECQQYILKYIDVLASFL